MSFARLAVTVGGAIAGLAAALLWWMATMVTVPAQNGQSDGDGWDSATIMDDGADLSLSLKRQARWNRYAALVTGVAVALQTIAGMMQ